MRDSTALAALGVGAGALLLLARQRAASAKKAPPTGRQWRGMPAPFFFQAQTAEAFGELATREDDVIMASLPKGGTTWCHRILHLLLRGVTDDGEMVPSKDLGAQGQIYPESLVLQRGAECDPESKDMTAVREQFFGTWGFEDDMCGQPSPRLFSTHLHGEFLPTRLLAPGGKGRLVVVLRNLKDTLTSLHFFRGEPKDGWLGNEHGPGSLARFLALDSPNAYGSAFSAVKRMDGAVAALQPEGRVLVVYYEDLQRCLPAQLERIASFLRVPLPPAKRDAVAKAVGFDSMKGAGGLKLASVLLRKGGIGDWKNHLSPEHWARFDAAFASALSDVDLAQPMLHYQQLVTGGLPKPREEQRAGDDPRRWPAFCRARLVEGRVVPDHLIAPAPSTELFQRPPSEFTKIVSPPGTVGAPHVAEAGRFHLFVSGVCPWATSARAARHLLGLQEAVSMEVADGQSSSGWVLLGGTACAPWADRPGPFYLHEAYQASDPLCTARITMPVLWDKARREIVSNDSWSIVKMLATAFAPLGKPAGPPPSLAPPSLSTEMEAVHAFVYDKLLNGVYKAGVAKLKGNAEGAAVAAAAVYATLDELERRLATRRYLLGTPGPTAVDLRLAMTLLRYDTSYRHAFGLDRGRGGILVAEPPATPGYPALAAYARDLYSLVQPSIDWPSFLQYYRWAPFPPDKPLPDVDRISAAAALPHGREKLAC